MKPLLLLLLLSLQTAPPVPRQAIKNGADSGTRDAQDSKERQNKTIALPVQNAVSAASAQSQSSDIAKEDKESHVVVENWPTKDGWDKFYIVLTAALVVIGAFTLAAIWYQARHGRRAADMDGVSSEQRRTAFCFGYMIQSGFNPLETGFYPYLTAPAAYTECT